MDIVSKNICEGIKEFFIWLGKGILSGIVNNSYWIFLCFCMGSLILYIAGIKKAGKYISISFILYFFFQCIKDVVQK